MTTFVMMPARLNYNALASSGCVPVDATKAIHFPELFPYCKPFLSIMEVVFANFRKIFPQSAECRQREQDDPQSFGKNGSETVINGQQVGEEQGEVTPSAGEGGDGGVDTHQPPCAVH